MDRRIVDFFVNLKDRVVEKVTGVVEGVQEWFSETK